MMITPGSDTSTVLTLLTAISDPEASKKALQDISDATEAHKKLIEDSRTELKKARDDLDAKQVRLNSNLESFNAAKADFDNFNATRTKQLNDQEAQLASVGANLRAMTDDLNKRETDVSARETAIAARTETVTQREVTAAQVAEEANTLKTELTNKIAALHTVMNADTGNIGSSM